jgi:hypothetical protein
MALLLEELDEPLSDLGALDYPYSLRSRPG